MTVSTRLPKYVRPYLSSSGESTFYWEPPAYYRKKAASEGVPFPFDNITLGIGLNAQALERAAKPYNDSFDAWRREAKHPDGPKTLGQYGTVRWLIETYLRSEQFMEKVGEISRPDYRNVFRAVCDLPTKVDRAVGELPVKSISPRAADKIYARMIDGEKYRRGEKAVVYCKTAWSVIGRLYPDSMARDPRDQDDPQSLDRRRQEKGCARSRPPSTARQFMPLPKRRSPLGGRRLPPLP